ncbi:unnamed protein product [Lactuca virosa]|uniref:Uncharacterized protein n=1 Tax=Lactuca virosa TaxID=75947 RepID=A0AAU9N673_9ASTR|nr:unnamed protein product [Lactuca virosa]
MTFLKFIVSCSGFSIAVKSQERTVASSIEPKDSQVFDSKSDQSSVVNFNPIGRDNYKRVLLLRIDNSSQSKIPHARSRTVEGSVRPYWRHECRSTSWLGCQRLFITIEVDSIIVPVLLNDYDAASGGLI